jgi:hypothetical protein
MQGGKSMETTENLREPKGRGAAAAPRTARKQSGNEASTSQQQNTASGSNPNQGTTPNQGASMNQSGSGNQGSMNQGATGQNAGDQDLLQHAKQAGGEIMNQVQQQAGTQFAQQKDNAATDLSHVVQAVRRFGESLAGEQGGPIARYAAEYGDKAAASLERFSTYIREQDPKQLLNDVQNFGRRRPALLIGGAFLLGFAGARLIKSSMEQSSQHQSFNAGADVLNVRPPGTNVPAPRPATPGVTPARPSTSPNTI